ncbi:Coq4 family protein [Dokdonia sp. PRO95]|uniref:Coq4 family protein n=1 Tax=Dokdonia sp. PRO95 TaxID=1239415 RepID=UPI0005534D39|nr:Coq4 family protein [Dokdonia sp. PRO95]
MKTLRYLLLERLYEWSKVPYKLLFKQDDAWGISVNQLLQYAPSSLGYHLGCFLLSHNFTPEPQLEDHDVFHVLTTTSIAVPDEIAMQWLLLGNGKRSLYLFIVLTVGTTLFIDHFKSFIKAFKRGKKANRFYNLNYLNLLTEPLTDLQHTLKIKPL